MFRKNNPDILFTRADKGNVTVAVDKNSYIERINAMLNDQTTYVKINKNSTKNIEDTLNTLLKKWLAKKYISDVAYKSMRSNEGCVLRAYSVPKIHKPEAPYRLIVSSVGSSLHKFAEFLHNIIYKNIPNAKSSIANSIDFVKKIKKTKIQRGHMLLSLDVTSLFTNVPIDLVLKGIKIRWKYIRNNTTIPLNDFLKL
ncbi:uncharacterized protein LOC109862415 [Pseudomyrmex gracilis]|uniref:uncharacterized protein LOC109862415 n=1 Tax=Pseudomyrmex gracilis TaxID=219809 RepID=UPI000995B3C2|nr:uncharacterized protein LOC109862415 [Pseudomyrmex gracilis]